MVTGYFSYSSYTIKKKINIYVHQYLAIVCWMLKTPHKCTDVDECLLIQPTSYTSAKFYKHNQI